MNVDPATGAGIFQKANPGYRGRAGAKKMAGIPANRGCGRDLGQPLVGIHDNLQLKSWKWPRKVLKIFCQSALSKHLLLLLLNMYCQETANSPGFCNRASNVLRSSHSLFLSDLYSKIKNLHSPISHGFLFKLKTNENLEKFYNGEFFSKMVKDRSLLLYRI